MPYGKFKEFQIFDPKKRLIHAACFEDRIFHHAVINLAGPVLEIAMMPRTYACRPGMGVHRAAQGVQHHLRQYRWYVKIDIDGYFSSINHAILLGVLLKRFKGAEFTALLERIIQSYHYRLESGLPIGSLTSQYFANYYLDGLDRLLANLSAVNAHIRDMDDIVWWCDSKSQALQALKLVDDYLHQERRLSIKKNIQINRSRYGITYCGYRILPATVRLSKRRKARYQSRRVYWEAQYSQGQINANQLQLAYAAVHAITQGTQSRAWRAENLRLHPPISV